MTTSLWRRCPVISKTGTAILWGWKHERDCSAEDAKAWLAVFAKDRPHEIYVISDKKPRTSR